MPARFSRRSLGCAALLLASAALAAPLAAQSVLGIGEDALIVPRGTVRVGISGSWSIANERYGKNTPGRADGSLEPIGTDFNLDSAGAAQFPALLPLQTSLRTLTGQTGLSISLGKTVLQVSHQITSVPIVLEMGLLRRLSIGVTVPIIKTHSSIFFNANPARNEGNVAINPALTDTATLNADTAFANQLVRAGTAVQNYCATTGAGDPQCVTGAATAANAIAFGQSLAQVYGASGLVPVAGSDVQNAIDTRGAAFKATLNQFATSNPSVPTITEVGVVGAASPMTRDEFQNFLGNPAYGVASASLATIDRVSLGDLELDAKIALYDGFAHDSAGRFAPAGLVTRFAVGGMLRAPTGHVDSPDNFVDIGTGTHAWGVGVRGYGDVFMGPHFWTSIVARYTVSLANDQDVRITDTPAEVFAAFYRRATVQRKLGNVMELEATPRWVVNDFFSLSAQYTFRHKGEDTYTGQSFTAGPDSTTGGTTVTVTPGSLSAETDATEHRLGAGISFSNLAAYHAGKARIPFEVTYQHFQTIKGSGGNVPKVFGDRIQLRLYARLFGN